MSRVNTVASALKRFLSRDETRPGSITPNEENPKYRFPGSASSNSLAPPANKPVGSMRITDQVIEEVDEQTTITSQRANDHRPNVRDIFGQNSGSTASINNQQQQQQHPTDPMDIPMKNKIYMRTLSTVEPSLFPTGGVEALLSTSAPSAGSPTMARTVPSSPVIESTKSLFDRDNKDRGSRETGKFVLKRALVKSLQIVCVTGS